MANKEQSKNSKNPEAGPPANRGNQDYSDRRSQRSAEARAHEYDAVSAAAFTDREPLRKTSRCVGKGAGFTGAKKKSAGNQ